MRVGDVVAGRFELLRKAGAGAMGVVYRAVDRASGEAVALKVLKLAGGIEAARFEREAAVLARLRHPGIVRYVGHGVTEGRPFLAMEWIEGESLSQRLARAPLTVQESLTLGLRVAEALDAAHRAGIVHRDIKPSNLALAGGAPEGVKLVDFGIARPTFADLDLTETGAIVGTLGYMAPEQARGDKGIDGRADVFALGCVLFRCLTGRHLFEGSDPVAFLFKVALENAPRLRELRADLPAALDEALARLLSRSPEGRPASGGDAAALLRGLGDLGGMSETPPPESVALTATERRFQCVVLVDAPPGDPGDKPARLREVAAHFGGELAQLADGSVAVVLSGTIGTDQAGQAARCALALRLVERDAAMALCAGYAGGGERGPAGETIDRAARLRSGPSAAPGIRIDQVTASLLDARFYVRSGDDHLVLVGERDHVRATRLVLGKKAPCVGREAELTRLASLLAACVDEPRAGAAFVLGGPGMGKSRLRCELVERELRRRGEDGLEVWLGRGDPMHAGSPLFVLAGALRRTAGILGGEPLAERQEKLRARVGRHVEGPEVERIAEFLGELLGTPFPDERRVELRAARQDARLMADQAMRAWEDFLAAETAVRPLLLILEDCHFGDLPSMRFIDATLRHLRHRPLFVAAFGRPEVASLFPDLWRGRGAQTLRLAALSPVASEALVRVVLGDDLPAAAVRRLVARASGNAFYLEQLIRAQAAGRGEDLPETVAAVVQARLDDLEPEARRILRAASVFGEVFWRGGVASLLGGEVTVAEVSGWLEVLAEREILERRWEGRFPGEVEHGFHHALLRETVYATLTDEDRALGHELAGVWLEQAGEADSLTLADHFERGRRPARAVGAFRRAAGEARKANDLAAVIERAERAVRCGAEGEVRGGLRLLQAEAHRWRGEMAEAETRALEAMEAMTPRGEVWFAALGEVAMASGRLGHVERLAALAALVLDAGVRDVVTGVAGKAAHRLAIALQLAGLRSLEAAVAALVDVTTEPEEPFLRAQFFHVRANRARLSGDAGAYARQMEVAVREYDAVGDARSSCSVRSNVGYGYLELGAFAEAERCLREAIAAADRLGLPQVLSGAQHNLGMVLARRGALEEARAVETEAVEAFRLQGDRRMEGASRIYLALVELLSGDLERAEQEARAAIEILATAPPYRAHGLAQLAQVLLAAGRPAEALAAAREAMRVFESLGKQKDGAVFFWLTYGEALRASGDEAAFQAAIATAREVVLAHAAVIEDVGLRASFLQNVWENARVLELS